MFHHLMYAPRNPSRALVIGQHEISDLVLNQSRENVRANAPIYRAKRTEILISGLGVSQMITIVGVYLAGTCDCPPDTRIPVDSPGRAFETSGMLGTCDHCDRLLPGVRVGFGAELRANGHDLLGFELIADTAEVDTIGIALGAIRAWVLEAWNWRTFTIHRTCHAFGMLREVGPIDEIAAVKP